MEGTPANSSMAGFRNSRDQGPASSDRYIARGIPTRIFMNRAMKVMRTEPTIIGIIPKTSPGGCHFCPRRTSKNPTSLKARKLS